MKRFLLYPLSALLVLVFGVTVYASIPSPSGIVNGCYTAQAVSGVHGLGS
jgi:hypothetical protein